MTRPFFIVDVFAERPYAGNQLAVVLDAEGLSDETMQSVAAEANYSETAFVTSAPERDGAFRVRLFTPAREIAFAGHPLLGSGWVVRHYLRPGASGGVVLRTAAGDVSVTFESAADGREVAWFRAPAVSLEATCPGEQIAAALGVVSRRHRDRDPCSDACGEHFRHDRAHEEPEALSAEPPRPRSVRSSRRPTASRHAFTSIATRPSMPEMTSARGSSSTRMACAKIRPPGTGRRSSEPTCWSIGCFQGAAPGPANRARIRGSSTLAGVVARADGRRPSRGERRRPRHSRVRGELR